jgi:hypothetical protein
MSEIKKSIFVEAREWFDKSGGNSYYSAQVWIDGEHIFTTGLTYGYDSAYEYNVAAELAQLGYLPEEYNGKSIRRAKDLGIDVYTVIYDAPKRNLWPAEYPVAA